jgi:hypothetical protein
MESRLKPTRQRRIPIRQNAAMVLLVLSLPSAASIAGRFGPPLDYETPAWRLIENGSPLLEFPFRFVPLEGEARSPEFLRGARAEAGSYLSSAWRIAAGDRNDRFSVRWLGYWEPGEIDCEILLTAKGEATFFLDGEEALSTKDRSIQSAFFLDSRVHELRVDFSHETGPALAQLEWRIGEEAWKPVVTRTDRKDERSRGWNAAYYLGSNYEHETFSRTDRALDFDWGEGGPFDRPEDLPTLDWRILNRSAGGTCGEVSANREGTLVLGLRVPQRRATTDASVTFANPLLELSGAAGEKVAVQFDREASKFTLEEGAAVEGGFEVGSLEFFLRAGDSVRFWETGGEFETGAQVAQAIQAVKKVYAEWRPKMGGSWAAWETNTIGSGAWWLQTLIESALPQSIERKEILRLAQFVAPDLLPKLETLSTGVDLAPQIENGLRAALGGLRAIEKKIQLNTHGGLDLLFGEGTGQEYSVEGWPFGENRFDIRCDPNELRIADASGTFLAFDAPGTIRNFQVDETGNWSGDVELHGPGNLRAGPAEIVSQILWNGSPLMTLREGGRYRARMPNARGEFQLKLLRNM